MPLRSHFALPLYARLTTTCFVILLVLTVLGTLPVFAQVDRGSIVGEIVDSAGAHISGAQVTITNLATNQIARATSDDQGNYGVNLLRIGAYSVTAEKQGFKQSVESRVEIGVGQVVRVNLTLTVGSVSETIDVTGAPPLLQTETSSLGTIETERRISTLPLNGRNFIALAYLGPGANGGQTGTNVSGGVFENERANEAISVNGLRVSNNNFLLNGVDNNEFGLGGVIVLPPPDAIQEFRTEENSMSAEFGRGGAAVNVVMKSGTNSLHGGVYEFLRNDKLDAANYFAEEKQPLRRNQFGAFLGGPIIKNRTFIFGNYEGSRLSEGQTFQTTVPGLAERAGDFSDRLTGNTFSPCGDNPGPGDPIFDTGAIFDPYSTTNFTCSNGSEILLRNQLSYNGNPNVIDPALINPVGQNVANIYPNPTSADLSNNYLSHPPHTNSQDSFGIRVDHRLRGQDQIFVSYNFGDVRSSRPNALGDLGGTDCCPSVSRSRAQHTAIGYTHPFSVNVLNDLHGGFFRYAVNALPFNYGKNLGEQLGIPNANRGDENSSGLTDIGVAGYAFLGDSEWLPEHAFENIFQVADTVTWVRGKHTLKFGVDFRRQQRNFFQLATPRGAFDFEGGFTNDLTTNNGGNGLADLLLGVPQAYGQDTLSGLYPTRYWDLAEFVQDDFRILPNLTLNLGLRYDLTSPANGRVSNFDLNRAVMVASYGPGAVSHAGVGFDKNDWAPRIGLAWSLSHNTVVRSAFGIFYSAEANTFDDLGLNPPQLTSLSRNYSVGTVPTAGQYISDGFPDDFPVQDVNHPVGSVKTTGAKRIMPRIMEWNLSVQHQFADNWVAQVGYVGTHAYHLWNHEATDLNQPYQPLDSNFSDDTGNYGRPYFDVQPDVAAVIPVDYAQLHMRYNALQASLNKHFSNGFNLLASYTFAKNLGNADGNVGGAIQDAHHPELEFGPVSPDLRHRFVISYLYELPVGHGRRFLPNMGRIADGILGGWGLAGITAAQTGEAETATMSSDLSNAGSASYRPDQAANAYNFSYDTATQASLGCTPGKQTLQCWYNPAVFVTPALAAGQQFAHVYGNSRIGNLRGPGLVNFDLVLQKNFTIRESQKVEFRAEMFNLFNHPNFGLPGTNPDVEGGASISNTANDNRQMEFALKYTF